MIEKLNRAIAQMKQADLLKDQAARAGELRERLLEHELIISVIGQFKRGKSSLINSFLGDEILPVGIIPLTTAVTEIRKGDSFRATVYFSDGSKKEINRDELPDYISEQKNPNNQKNVEVVKLWTEKAPFGPDITLVDTPGVGSVHQHNTRTSHDYIEKSDGVLFILSVDSPVSELERDFLLKAREHAAKFYFAVNKTDAVTGDNLREFLSYCKAVLSEAIDADVSLYPVSAKTGDGVSFLINKLSEDVQGFYDELMEASISMKLSAILAQAKARLSLYLKAAAMPAEEMETKISQIKSKQKELSALSDEVHVLTKVQTDRLIGHIDEYLEKILVDILDKVQVEMHQTYEDLKSFPSRQFESKLKGVLEDILNENINILNDSGLIKLREGYGTIVKSLNEKSAYIAQYIFNMVKECFDVEYPINVNEYSVSKRSDNFAKVTLYRENIRFSHFLPRYKANMRIFERLSGKALDDLRINKVRIVYDYRYKMQESLRTLCSEFSDDIAKMNNELNELLDRVEQSHGKKSDELRRMEDKLTAIIEQLNMIDA